MALAALVGYGGESAADGGGTSPTRAAEKELAQQRAEQERQRADQEQQRAERLAEQLRALGVEPEV